MKLNLKKNFFLSGFRVDPDNFYPDNYPDKNRISEKFFLSGTIRLDPTTDRNTSKDYQTIWFGSVLTKLIRKFHIYKQNYIRFFAIKFCFDLSKIMCDNI